MPLPLRESHQSDLNLPLLFLLSLALFSFYLAKETSYWKAQGSWALDFKFCKLRYNLSPTKSYIILNKLLNLSIKIKILIISNPKSCCEGK